ncbi:hypothetical protein AVDCRST_MAG92-791 [uncultured Coleofasciculus sp.]|uniref:Uncharacterized protein n=1 Tax=uncultured Coleofasciculus sp. TaxID=1267456 RepID=A0A6J4HJ96_9CYAN|nr:hypothetical protein AVDCRST_MAG92-791 [uncultured Coleofasciculus sp.]
MHFLLAFDITAVLILILTFRAGVLWHDSLLNWLKAIASTDFRAKGDRTYSNPQSKRTYRLITLITSPGFAVAECNSGATQTKPASAG